MVEIIRTMFASAEAGDKDGLRELSQEIVMFYILIGLWVTQSYEFIKFIK